MLNYSPAAPDAAKRCALAHSFNQSAAANRRPALQPDGSGNLSAIVAAARAFPAAVAELGRSVP
jgi:hypothetical protein